jgi:hypothetical protein
MTYPRLTIVTAGGSVAVLGIFQPLSVASLRWFVRAFPLSWVSA